VCPEVDRIAEMVFAQIPPGTAAPLSCGFISIGAAMPLIPSPEVAPLLHGRDTELEHD
jgi:hypothetical protein